MHNKITQKFADLLGPITDDRSNFSTFSHSSVSGGYNVTEMSKVQKELTEEILKDHFKLKEINWMELPSGLDKNQKPIIAQTIKLTDDEVTIYEGKTAYVYMIIFSPKFYNPTNFITNPVKDGCTFGPLVYNSETFEPSRTIILTFNPTFPQDIDSKEDETEIMKQQLRDKLEKVLADPDAYMPEAYRGCMVRMAIV